MRKKGTSQRTWTTLEVIYVARFYKHDGYKMVAYALDRSPAMVNNLFKDLERTNQLEYFRKKWDEIHDWR